MVPAEVVQSLGAARLVALVGEQVVGRLRVGEAVRRPRQALADGAHPQVGVCPPQTVAESLEQGQRLGEVMVGVDVVAQATAGQSEAAVGVGLPGGVTEPLGCAQRGAKGADPVVPPPSTIHEHPDRRGQPPGVLHAVGRGGQLHCLVQHLALAVEPRQGLIAIGDRLDGHVGIQRSNHARA
nr:hypothetical protein [Micromonospora halophytica]